MMDDDLGGMPEKIDAAFRLLFGDKWSVEVLMRSQVLKGPLLRDTDGARLGRTAHDRITITITADGLERFEG